MTETQPGTEAREEFPYGVGRAESADGPIEYTRYDAASALAVLARSHDGDEPAEIVILSDEQLLGVEGHRRTQPVALPWAEEHPEVREVIAAVGVRSLMASGLVTIGEDQETGERRWLVDPSVNGSLVLRRTADLIASGERQVRSEQGLQTARIYWYVHPEGVLEEEVTPSGMHVFRAAQPAMLPERMVLLIDQDAVASAAGDPVTVTDEDLQEGGEYARRLADARAVTIVSSLDTRSEAVKQLIMYASTDEVLVQQTEENPSDDPAVDASELEISLKAVDREELLELAAWFFVREEG